MRGLLIFVSRFFNSLKTTVFNIEPENDYAFNYTFDDNTNPTEDKFDPKTMESRVKGEYADAEIPPILNNRPPPQPRLRRQTESINSNIKKGIYRDPILNNFSSRKPNQIFGTGWNKGSPEVEVNDETEETEKGKDDGEPDRTEKLKYSKEDDEEKEESDEKFPVLQISKQMDSDGWSKWMELPSDFVSLVKSGDDNEEAVRALLSKTYKFPVLFNERSTHFTIQNKKAKFAMHQLSVKDLGLKPVPEKQTASKKKQKEKEKPNPNAFSQKAVDGLKSLFDT